MTHTPRTYISRGWLRENSVTIPIVAAMRAKLIKITTNMKSSGLFHIDAITSGPIHSAIETGIKRSHYQLLFNHVNGLSRGLCSWLSYCVVREGYNK